MRKLLGLCALLVATPLAAKDSLGVFENWGAFRDASVPRCYAISTAEPNRLRRDFEPFATIGTWPRQNIRGQVHFRMSRLLAKNAGVSLRIDGRTFDLVGGGGDAWAQDTTMDAAIVAAIRSANTMTVRATDNRGRRFSNRYSLNGAATAMDAATLACANRRR